MQKSIQILTLCIHMLPHLLPVRSFPYLHPHIQDLYNVCTQLLQKLPIRLHDSDFYPFPSIHSFRLMLTYNFQIGTAFLIA
jgi:hypothetical protein